MKILRAFFFALATLLLYFGLPLLGWGLDDPGGFFAAPPRAGYAAAVLVFAVCVGIQAFGGTEGIRGGKCDLSKWNRRESFVRFGLVAALYLALLLIPFADRRGFGVLSDFPLLRWPGAVLAAAGYGFVFWSGLALGRQYSPEVTIQRDHRLITSGPYRWIRHPRYLGILLLGAGYSLVFRSWIGLAFAVLIGGALLLRIRDEENLLGKEFGEEWNRYVRASWRLVPGIF